MNSYYGGYRTRTFGQIFNSADSFVEGYQNTGMGQPIKPENVRILFYLLYARYGSSHIAFETESQFVYSVYSIIFMYGPAWEKRLEIQDKLRKLTETEIETGGKAVYNHAYNPGTMPSTSSLEELEYINDQNTTNYKKSKMEAYASLYSLIQTDVTEELIGKFKKLFIKVLAPDYDLLYATYPENYVIPEDK